MVRKDLDKYMVLSYHHHGPKSFPRQINGTMDHFNSVDKNEFVERLRLTVDLVVEHKFRLTQNSDPKLYYIAEVPKPPLNTFYIYLGYTLVEICKPFESHNTNVKYVRQISRFGN